jgi:hypothetical protein
MSPPTRPPTSRPTASAPSFAQPPPRLGQIADRALVATTHSIWSSAGRLLPASPGAFCHHTLTITRITAYLGQGGTIEKSQAIAFRESFNTTKLYDCTSDQTDLDEIERIRSLAIGPLSYRQRSITLS